MDRGGEDLRNSVLGMLSLRGQVDIQEKVWNRQLDIRDELREEFQSVDTSVEITGRQMLFENMEQNEITKTVAENKRCPSITP